MDTAQIHHATPVYGRKRGTSSPADFTNDRQTNSSLQLPTLETRLATSTPCSPAEEFVVEEEQQPLSTTEQQAGPLIAILGGSCVETESTGSKTRVASTPDNQEVEFAKAILNPAPSDEDIDRGIRQGYRSPVFQFLETRTPTDTLPEDSIAALPELERNMLYMKRRWFSSLIPAWLEEIVDFIIKDRKDSPITNFVCLGVGTGDWCSQFLIFSHVVAQLGRFDPSVLGNIYVQDPMMSAEHRSLFINHGCKVVESPTVFEYINANTFLMAASVSTEHLVGGLEGRGVRELALFIGNGKGILDTANSSQQRFPSWIRTVGPLLDEELCCHRDFPTNRVLNESDGELFRGLAGLDVWWRPVFPENSIVAIRYNYACALGFPGSLEEFEAAYRLGYSQLAKQLRDRIVCSFVAASHDRNRLPFQEYYRRYYIAELNEGLTEQQRRYEEGIARWQSMNKVSGRQRTWLEYINGDRSISRHPACRITGWKEPAQKLPSTSKEQRELLEVKKRWENTANARKLTEILDQITQDRRHSLMSNLVCLGVGTCQADTKFDVARFMVVLEITKQLVIAKPDLLHNLFVQDAEMSQMTSSMSNLCKKYGFRVVDESAALDLIGPTTCLISLSVQSNILVPALMGKPIDHIAMFVGNGEEMLIEARRPTTSNPQHAETLSRILDENTCDMVAFPCDEPDKRSSIIRLTSQHKWPALESLDIWWRPSRTEEEEFDFRFKRARDIGFPNNIDFFRDGWKKGYKELPTFMQNTVVLSYVSGLDAYGSPTTECRDFGSHVWEYVNRKGPLSEKQRILESHVDAWLVRSNAQTRRTFSFTQYLKCRESLQVRQSGASGRSK
ncbi:hypothetical protein ONS96_010752 [Cadophora gregata f. sp. sojae]|nr:hypothetical protein ONS96_010752 [Cadophora gregata f. sp. sojae]